MLFTLGTQRGRIQPQGFGFLHGIFRSGSERRFQFFYSHGEFSFRFFGSKAIIAQMRPAA